jgi:hypothetical protein
VTSGLVRPGGADLPEPEKLVTEILATAPEGHRRRLLIVLDQFEDVVADAERHQSTGPEFAQLLQALIACRVRIVATLLSESVPLLQESTWLSGVPLKLFPLRPIGTDTLREIIVDPARRGGIGISSELVEALVRDTPDGNALPPAGVHPRPARRRRCSRAKRC